jgi:hypothetical protein
MSNDRNDGLKKIGAPTIIFASAVLLLLVAWGLVDYPQREGPGRRDHACRGCGQSSHKGGPAIVEILATR